MSLQNLHKQLSDSITVSEHDEYIDFTIDLNGNNMAILNAVDIDYEYAYQSVFEGTIDYEEFELLFNPEIPIINLEYLEVKDAYKYRGLGKFLMSYAMKYLDNQGYVQFCGNASPMGGKGLNLPSLLKFYKAFGFKHFRSEGNNAVIYKVM